MKYLLKEGNVICDKCGGYGFLNDQAIIKDEVIYFRVCPSCTGSGFFDWIENIVGKKDRRVGSPLDNGEMYVRINPSKKGIDSWQNIIYV